MMTYGGESGANAVLSISLTPITRCIWKQQALDNGADPDFFSSEPYLSFARNRLIPASIISKLIMYSIVFKDWDGTILKSENIKKGGNITAPSNPSRQGYTFTGWNPTVPATAQADGVYIAQYAADSYLIQFVDYDGTVLKSENVAKGDRIVPPADPTRSGYTFTGWSPSVPATAQSAGTYTAQYSKIKTRRLGSFYAVSESGDSVYTDYYATGTIDGRKVVNDSSGIYCNYQSGLPGGAPSSFTFTVDGIHYKNGTSNNISGTFVVSNFGTSGYPTVTQSGNLDGLGVFTIAGRGIIFCGETRVRSTNPNAPGQMDSDEYYKFDCIVEEGHGLEWYTAMGAPIQTSPGGDQYWQPLALVID